MAVVFALMLLACIIGNLVGWVILQLIQQARVAAQKVRHAQIVAHLQAHPRYPFGLPIANTWSAGEFVCERCGVNGYFSMVKLEPHNVPPHMRERAGEQDEIDRERGTIDVRGLYQAPLVFQCRACGALLANGDAARIFDKPGEEGPP